jgi:hypothetical protein
MAMSLLRFGGKMISLATLTGLLYRPLSTTKSKWAAPRALRGLGHPGATFARSRHCADVDGRYVPIHADHNRLLTALSRFVSHAANPDFLRLAVVSEFAMETKCNQEVRGLKLSEHILQSEPGPSCLLRLVDG